VNVIQKIFNRSNTFFVIWCMVAAFGAYFCMYAFRKPFNAGVYAELSLWGLHYKSILVITQVMGYMFSKFIGIKIISELKAANRNKLIVTLILVAEIALLLFGLVPYPYNFICLFLNGLPLGMVWGVVFSYLEGRRFTEVLAMGLSTSLIISSGYLKTIYFYVHEWLPSLTEFWLPFVIGLLFLPLFLLFVWMLSVIPAPTEEDILRRSPRLPMTNQDKKNVFRDYGIGLVGLVIVYAMLATLRDFRDNFSVEIWNEIEPGWNKTVFAKTETVAGIVVLIAVGLLSTIKSNRKGFVATNILIIGGLGVSGISTLLFHTHAIQPFWWMLLSGTGLFLAYIPFQVAMFERMIAFFRIKANAGFFVYICDAIGYLGSVVLLLYKELMKKDLSWSNMLIKFSYMQVIVSLAIMFLSLVFFLNRKKQVQPIAKVPEFN